MKARRRKQFIEKDNTALTLEKLEIAKRLHTLDLTLTKFIERFDAHMVADSLAQEQISELVKRHDQMLMGTNETPGMHVKVDRLTQVETNRKWSIRALWVGFIAVSGKLLADALTKMSAH